MLVGCHGVVHVTEHMRYTVRQYKTACVYKKGGTADIRPLHYAKGFFALWDVMRERAKTIKKAYKIL